MFGHGFYPSIIQILQVRNGENRKVIGQCAGVHPLDFVAVEIGLQSDVETGLEDLFGAFAFENASVAEDVDQFRVDFPLFFEFLIKASL